MLWNSHWDSFGSLMLWMVGLIVVVADGPFLCAQKQSFHGMIIFFWNFKTFDCCFLFGPYEQSIVA